MLCFLLNNCVIFRLGFQCKNGDCIDARSRCDNDNDCVDGSDEADCFSDTDHFLLKIFIDYDSIKSDGFRIFWVVHSDLSSVTNDTYLFMPAYSYYNHSDPNQLHLVNTTWIKEQSFVFDNLQPESTYKVFIYTKLSKNGTILNPISNLNVTTRSLNPDPPENLTATILDYKTIKLDWLAPINKSRKTLDGYKILYSPPIPSVVVRTTTEQIELCCFEVGIEYKFQVFSLRKKLESLRSATINVRINPQVIVKNLRAKKLTTSSITLEWQANTNNVSKWFIIFDCGDYFTNFSKNITIDESLAEIDDLAPGVLYEFKIFPFVNDRVGFEGVTNNIITIETLGEKLPSVVFDHNAFSDKISLNWSSPSYLNDTAVDWTYGIFLGESISDLILKAQTKDNVAILKNLISCHNYYIEIRLMKPHGIGPSQSTKLITTKMDHENPPVSIYHDRIIKNSKIKIFWSKNSFCEITEKIGYILSIHNLITDHEDRFRFRPTDESYKYLILSTHFGAVYEIKLTVAKSNSDWNQTLIVEALPMPTITKLFANQETDGRIKIDWSMVDDDFGDNERHLLSYQVFLHNNKNVTDGQMVQLKEPPAFIKPKIKSNHYFIGITVYDDHGYVSQMSKLFHLYYFQNYCKSETTENRRKFNFFFKIK